LAWTTPKTWASGYVVLAADLNTHLRDNLNVTAPAVMTTAGDIIYASGANTPARLAKSTTSTQYLANTGTSNIPAWNEVALATGVSGTLPVGNGGTGATTLTANGAIIGNGTSALTSIDMSTKGGLLAGDGSGNPRVLAVGGTNTHVLTVDSSETTGMKWASGGGDFVLIGIVEASDDATIGVSGVPASTYDWLIIVGSDLRPATDGVRGLIKSGTAAGIDEGASDYGWWKTQDQIGTTTFAAYLTDSGDSGIRLGRSIGNGSNEGIGFVISMTRPPNGTQNSSYQGSFLEINSGAAIEGQAMFGLGPNNVITQFQFQFSSGNVTSGTFAIYGASNA